MQSLLHTVKTQLQTITLTAGLIFLFLGNGQLYLYSFNSLVAGTNTVLGIIGKVTADLNQLLLFLLLLTHQLIHFVLELTGLLLQLQQHFSGGLYVLLGVFVYLKYLAFTAFH